MVAIAKLLMVIGLVILFFFSGTIKFLQFIGGAVCLESCELDPISPPM